MSMISINKAKSEVIIAGKFGIVSRQSHNIFIALFDAVYDVIAKKEPVCFDRTVDDFINETGSKICYIASKDGSCAMPVIVPVRINSDPNKVCEWLVQQGVDHRKLPGKLYRVVVVHYDDERGEFNYRRHEIFISKCYGELYDSSEFQFRYDGSIDKFNSTTWSMASTYCTFEDIEEDLKNFIHIEIKNTFSDRQIAFYQQIRKMAAIGAIDADRVDRIVATIKELAGHAD